MMNNAQPAQPAAISAPTVPPWITTDENKAKARKFFSHAKKAAEQRNFDYAIKLYVDGLALWPDAVEEGLKPLRVTAMARKLEGGKPAGFLTSRTRSTSGKDPIANLTNALYLYGFDPTNIGHLEIIQQIAAALRAPVLAAWTAPVLADLYNSSKRLSESHYSTTCEAMDRAADIAMALENDQVSIDILNAAITTAQIWCGYHPDSHAAPRARSNATGKLTIVKGHFAKADGFTESLKDAEAARDLHDRDKVVHTADRTQQLIAKARKDWEANREVPAKLIHLIDLMSREERPELESEAIRLLEAEYKSSQNYNFKAKADDIRIRQGLNRRRDLLAAAKADPGNGAAQRAYQEHNVAQTRLELDIFLDRLKAYPTDLRVKFELAKRLFLLQRYDEAIPLLQQAQGDGRSRTESRLLIGRCFFEKHFHDQAIETLRATVLETESTTGPVVLELNYWLGRALQAAGQAVDARKVFGQLIQLDYNYRDARQRLEALVAGENKTT